MPYNTNGKNAMLTGGLGNAVGKASLHTGDPGSTGTNEAAGGSPAYAKQTVAWNAAASGQRTSSGDVTFDVAAGTYYALGLWDTGAATFYGWHPLDGSVKGVGTADTADVITSNAHGLANDDRVIVAPVVGESLPAGLAAGTFYFVVSATTNTFKVSATSGGAAVDITAVGELAFQKLVPQTFVSQGQVKLSAGQIILDATAVG